MTQTCPQPLRINRLALRSLARWLTAGLTLATCFAVMPTRSASAQSLRGLDDPRGTDLYDARGRFDRRALRTHADAPRPGYAPLDERPPARRRPNGSQWEWVPPEVSVRPQPSNLQLDRAYLDDLNHANGLSRAAMGLYISGSILSGLFATPFFWGLSIGHAYGFGTLTATIAGVHFVSGVALFIAGIICDVASGSARSALNTNYPQFAFDVAPVEGGAVASAAIRF